MRAVKVVIQSLDDVKNGKPIVEGMTPENIEETHNLTVGVLESGMESGKTSLMFVLQMGDGTFKVAEMSAGQFEMLTSVVKGAVMRFDDEKK
jgi:hypothetical protein